jgi:hypothetical protein
MSGERDLPEPSAHSYLGSGLEGVAQRVYYHSEGVSERGSEGVREEQPLSVAVVFVEK